MNKKFFIAVLGLSFMGSITASYAQSNRTNQSPTEEEKQEASGIPTMSLEKNKIPASAQIFPDNVTWQRDVYRMLDLTNDKNAALYYPPQPDGQKENLFSLLFENVSQGKLKVYDYLDGREVFSKDYLVKFDELLNRFWIPFEAVPNPQNVRDTLYKVEQADIPSNEVTLYYVKETYYLDQRTSSIKIKTIAFCPVLVREDETGEIRKYPLFWVPFDGARELLSTHTISTSNYNAASRMSIYDYFMRRQYKGDIYKVYNLRNQNIMDYCKTPEEIAAEQQRLEKELQDIMSSLWISPQKDSKQGDKPSK